MNVFEKIVERLEKKIFKAELHDFGWEGQTVDNLLCLGDVVDTINQVAEKYNNGWIPVEERLPEEHNSMFAKFKGTDRWRDSMFEKTSNVVNVTVVDTKGQVAVTHATTIDGNWSCDLLRYNKQFRIIAWQPLPEPYKEGE